MIMKKELGASEIAIDKASVFLPILELLYSYTYYDEPEYNKILFMFEKILLDMDIVPSHNNMDWISRD